MEPLFYLRFLLYMLTLPLPPHEPFLKAAGRNKAPGWRSETCMSNDWVCIQIQQYFPLFHPTDIYILSHLSPYPLLPSLTFKSKFLIYFLQAPSTCLCLPKPTSVTLLQQCLLKMMKEREKEGKTCWRGRRGSAKEHLGRIMEVREGAGNSKCML